MKQGLCAPGAYSDPTKKTAFYNAQMYSFTHAT